MADRRYGSIRWRITATEGDDSDSSGNREAQRESGPPPKTSKEDVLARIAAAKRYKEEQQGGGAVGSSPTQQPTSPMASSSPGTISPIERKASKEGKEWMEPMAVADFDSGSEPGAASSSTPDDDDVMSKFLRTNEEARAQ
jgi:hypothetical protein